MQNENVTTATSTVALYVVKGPEGNYFGGYDAAANKSTMVADPINAKKFTNKYDIRLRPNETIVELLVDLTKSSIVVSEPFRPRRRQQSDKTTTA